MEWCSCILLFNQVGMDLHFDGTKIREAQPAESNSLTDLTCTTRYTPPSWYSSLQKTNIKPWSHFSHSGIQTSLLYQNEYQMPYNHESSEDLVECYMVTTLKRGRWQKSRARVDSSPLGRARPTPRQRASRRTCGRGDQFSCCRRW